MMNIAVRSDDHFITVDGLNIRYLEEGSGVPAILLHGASLGSSADVFRRNLKELAAGGIRAIAFDLPGFGQGFVDYFHGIKQGELARYQTEVTDWEQREYFELF